MLTGTRARLSILAPTRADPIAREATATLSLSKVEFADVSARDTTADGLVVPASIDVVGGRVIARVLSEEAGVFVDVTGKGAFNGFALTFDTLTGNARARIIDAELVADQTTSGITANEVGFDADTLFLNLDALPFAKDDTVSVRLGFALDGGAGAEDLAGYEGRDRISGGDGADRLRGNKGADLISGDGGADRILGGSGHDTLRGGDGADLIKGGPGFDRLLGGAGADTLIGGGGEDEFIFHKVSDSLAEAAGRDTIIDFVPREDRINLGHIDASEQKRGDQDFRFIGAASFSDKAGELRAFAKPSGTYVAGDTDGDGRADFSIRLDGVQALTAGDFIL